MGKSSKFIEEQGKLTQKQMDFAKNLIFVCDWDEVEAAKLAGYDYKEDKILKQYIKTMMLNTHLREYIKTLISERDEMSVVDKLWVLTKLKSLYDANSDKPSLQLKVLELLGKHLGIFNEKTTEQEVRDASGIVNGAFEERKKQLLIFQKKQEAGETNDSKSIVGGTDNK